EQKTGAFVHPRETLPFIRNTLKDVSFLREKMDHILHCIEYHEEYSFSSRGKTATDIETLILQDADNLDAMGAIGIARTFAFGGANGIPLWLPDIPTTRETYDEADERDPSVL